MDETPQIGMDQLSYFVNMMKSYLDPHWEKRFWNLMRENCPELMQAVDASFMREYRRITFTRDLFSPAFEPDPVEDSEVQPPVLGDQEKTMNLYTENVKRGAALLDSKHPEWRDQIDTCQPDLGSYRILEQVFKYYEENTSTLMGINRDEYESFDAWYDSHDFQTVLAHGFSVDVLSAEDDVVEWQALQEAWIAELQREQLPGQLEPGQESRI